MWVDGSRTYQGYINQVIAVCLDAEVRAALGLILKKKEFEFPKDLYGVDIRTIKDRNLEEERLINNFKQEKIEGWYRQFSTKSMRSLLRATNKWLSLLSQQTKLSQAEGKKQDTAPITIFELKASVTYVYNSDTGRYCPAPSEVDRLYQELYYMYQWNAIFLTSREAGKWVSKKEFQQYMTELLILHMLGN